MWENCGEGNKRNKVGSKKRKEENRVEVRALDWKEVNLNINFYSIYYLYYSATILDYALRYNTQMGVREIDENLENQEPTVRDFLYM